MSDFDERLEDQAWEGDHGADPEHAEQDAVVAAFSVGIRRTVRAPDEPAVRWLWATPPQADPAAARV